MCYIGDHIIAVVDHPVVSVNDGVARVSILYPLRDDGVGCVIITRLRHIGEDTVDFDMLIPFAKFNQSRIRHAVKVALRADVKGIDTMMTNQPLYLLMQLLFDATRTITVSEECTRYHSLHLYYLY